MLGVSSRHLACQIQKGTRFTISFAKFLHGAACSCHSSRLPALTRYSEWYFSSHSVPSSSPPPSASYHIHCLKNSTENFEKSEISQNSHFSQCKNKKNKEFRLLVFYWSSIENLPFCENIQHLRGCHHASVCREMSEVARYEERIFFR